MSIQLWHEPLTLDLLNHPLHHHHRKGKDKTEDRTSDKNREISAKKQTNEPGDSSCDEPPFHSLPGEFWWKIEPKGSQPIAMDGLVEAVLAGGYVSRAKELALLNALGRAVDQCQEVARSHVNRKIAEVIGRLLTITLSDPDFVDRYDFGTDPTRSPDRSTADDLALISPLHDHANG